MSQPALVCRFYLRHHLAGLRLCGVHYRRVRWRHRGLAGLIIDGNVVRPGCAGTGTVVTVTFGHHPSQRQRLSVCLAGLHAAVAGCRAAGFHGEYR